tara:strand:- start:630 stop:1010 length:381 start_codon:yes stop_codon:yes gene_type:complete
MATITPKLTVTGTAADWGASINLSVSGSLTTGSPSKGISKADVASGDTFIVMEDAAADGTTFVYIKNNNTSGSGYVELQSDDGNETFGTLNNGEFAWIPIDSNQGMQVLGAVSSVEIEYGYWTRTT